MPRSILLVSRLLSISTSVLIMSPGRTGARNLAFSIVNKAMIDFENKLPVMAVVNDMIKWLGQMSPLLLEALAKFSSMNKGTS